MRNSDAPPLPPNPLPPPSSGYDSTDMAAVEYRLKDLKRDWVVAVTDAGQANHFHMVFDAARCLISKILI